MRGHPLQAQSVATNVLFYRGQPTLHVVRAFESKDGGIVPTEPKFCRSAGFRPGDGPAAAPSPTVAHSRDYDLVGPNQKRRPPRWRPKSREENSGDPELPDRHRTPTIQSPHR